MDFFVYWVCLAKDAVLQGSIIRAVGRQIVQRTRARRQRGGVYAESPVQRAAGKAAEEP